MTSEECKYINVVLQRLIDVPMIRKIKVDSEYCMLNHQTGKPFVVFVDVDLDEVIITPPSIIHPNWPKTINAIKYIRDWGMDHIHGFEVEFNASFTKFRKIKINQ